MLKMQLNPEKQKLTGRLFRGFWIRECAHFHPVGQSPGEMCGRTESQRGWRQEESHQQAKDGAGMLESRNKRFQHERGKYNRNEQIMRAPGHKHGKDPLSILHKRKDPN